jgi:hypothetical protein
MCDGDFELGLLFQFCKKWKGERINCNEEDGWKEQTNNREGGVKYGYVDRKCEVVPF